MDLIYKTLFEIKLEHEYFLTLEDGKSLFEDADPSSRITRLQQADENERESFSRDIACDFPDKLKPVYSQYGLRLLPSYSGCRVLVRVTPVKQLDNSTVFQPFTQIPEDLGIFILLLKKNNLPDAYTNGRLNRSVPSLYLFSNENINGPKIFPFIASPVSALDPGILYEQGELAVDAGNNLVEMYYGNTGNLQQRVVNSAVTSFASENDRILLPGKFYYSLPPNNSVTELEISVTDNSSNEIKKFSFSQSQPFSRLLLDFTDKADVLQFTGTGALAGRIFTINVAGNNGWSDSKKVVFGDHLTPVSAFGAVYIRPVVTNAVFNILTDEGRIIQSRDPLGTLSEAPVFEIPFKSRYGHFRYINSNGKELKLDASLNNFLFKENKALISQVPVSLSRYYPMIPDNTGTATRYLPNPRSYDIKIDSFNRIYFDITVPESDNFRVQ